jgi:hypothetical protein
MATATYAETEVKVNGQVRVRGEVDRRSFDSSYSHAQTFSIMRTRVGITATVDNNAHAFVQFQDSRTLGGFDQFGNAQSATLNDGKNVDLHQAYVKANLWTEGERSFGFLAGRFELNQGNQRVFGAVGWHNVGRSWEGGLLYYDNNKFNFTAAFLKPLELNNMEYNDDFDAYAAILKFKETNLDIFGLYEVSNDTIGLGPGLKAFERFNFGFYFKKTHKKAYFEVNGVIQTGTMPGLEENVPNTSEIDIKAHMFAFEAGYNFEGERTNGKFGIGLDYTSGDDGSNLAEYKTYDNLYYTGHKFRGYMDYFVSNPMHGLVDFMLRGKVEFLPGWYAMGDLHFFSAAEDYEYDAGENLTSSDIGTEFDFTLKTTRVKGVTLQWGASVFKIKDNYSLYLDDENDAPQNGFWLYEQATINF